MLLTSQCCNVFVRSHRWKILSAAILWKSFSLTCLAVECNVDLLCNLADIREAKVTQLTIHGISPRVAHEISHLDNRLGVSFAALATKEATASLSAQRDGGAAPSWLEDSESVSTKAYCLHVVPLLLAVQPAWWPMKISQINRTTVPKPVRTTVHTLPLLKLRRWASLAASICFNFSRGKGRRLSGSCYKWISRINPGRLHTIQNTTSYAIYQWELLICQKEHGGKITCIDSGLVCWSNIWAFCILQTPNSRLYLLFPFLNHGWSPCHRKYLYERRAVLISINSTDHDFTALSSYRPGMACIDWQNPHGHYLSRMERK